MERFLLNLVLSSRYSDDARILGQAAKLHGWQVVKLESSNIPENLHRQPCRLYAEGFLAEYIAEKLGLTLLRPADDCLSRLEPKFLQRNVKFYKAENFERPQYIAFIKPADQKFFAAKVYSQDELIPGLEQLNPDDPILVSDAVNFVREYRFFALRRQIKTGSIYLLNGNVPQVSVGYEGEADNYWITAKSFAQMVCNETSIELPESFVIDVGLLENNTWAVIEFNPTWASGIYGCNPYEVLTNGASFRERIQQYSSETGQHQDEVCGIGSAKR